MNTIVEIVRAVRVYSLTFIIPGFIFMISLGTGRLSHNIGAGIFVLIGLTLTVLT
jgi:hypothetical protein